MRGIPILVLMLLMLALASPAHATSETVNTFHGTVDKNQEVSVGVDDSEC